ncbi:MAG: hypothetical protein RLZZ232_2916 [Planctomycetota bacterium]|jgi:hypothetical protein
MFIAAKTVTTRTHPAACHDQCRPTLRLTGASGGIIPQERIQSMPQLLLDRQKIGASLQKRLRRPDKPADREGTGIRTAPQFCPTTMQSGARRCMSAQPFHRSQKSNFPYNSSGKPCDEKHVISQPRIAVSPPPRLKLLIHPATTRPAAANHSQRSSLDADCRTVPLVPESHCCA